MTDPIYLNCQEAEGSSNYTHTDMRPYKTASLSTILKTVDHRESDFKLDESDAKMKI